MTFIYGIIGLGVIVFIHEFGHFLAARRCGVVVESFSIGMGPVLFHKTINGTDYRISLIPLGGYCAMKGEQAFQNAIENNQNRIEGESDEFYGVHPLKRAFIAFSGPFFNVLFAIVCMTIVAWVGYDYYTTDNRIIIATDVYPEIESVAAEAGIKTGDRIVSINGKDTPWFRDIYEEISLNADTPINCVIEREGYGQQEYQLTPKLDPSTGAGKIGIMAWVDPIITDVEQGSTAATAGLQDGDLIVAVNGKPVKNTMEVSSLLPQDRTFVCTIKRGETLIDINLKPSSSEDTFGFYFKQEKIHTEHYNLFTGIGNGISEAVNMIGLTFKSLALLFKGVDLTSAVSGPVRITKMLGDTAIEGFSAGFSIGIVSVMQFLALINISLFIMNLLPIPILDGGLVLFAVIEAVFHKQVPPKVLYIVQIFGIICIGALFVFALFGDIRYLIYR